MAIKICKFFFSPILNPHTLSLKTNNDLQVSFYVFAESFLHYIYVKIVRKRKKNLFHSEYYILVGFQFSSTLGKCLNKIKYIPSIRSLRPVVNFGV